MTPSPASGLWRSTRRSARGSGFPHGYGLYDQAADLVQIRSRASQSTRAEVEAARGVLRLGNKDRFLQTARDWLAAAPCAGRRVGEDVIMGRQIAPDDPLFANAVR